jgi:hypothetical protein
MHNNLSDHFYHRLFIVIRQIQAIEIMFVIVKTIASEFFAVAQLQSFNLLKFACMFLFSFYVLII